MAIFSISVGRKLQSGPKWQFQFRYRFHCETAHQNATFHVVFRLLVLFHIVICSGNGGQKTSKKRVSVWKKHDPRVMPIGSGGVVLHPPIPLQIPLWCSLRIEKRRKKSIFSAENCSTMESVAEMGSKRGDVDFRFGIFGGPEM